MRLGGLFARAGVSRLLAGIALVVVLATACVVALRVQQDLEGKAWGERLTQAQRRYLGHSKPRPCRNRGCECNVMEKVQAVLGTHAAVWSRWDRASGSERDGALADLRGTLQCNREFWPEGFVDHPAPELSSSLYANAFGALLGASKEAPAGECLRLAREAIALGQALAVGGVPVRVDWASQEVASGVSAALGCVERAKIDDIRLVASDYLDEAAVVPPVQWTYEYQYLRDAEFERTLFLGRPIVPAIWRPDIYPLTSGSHILERMRLAVAAAERASAIPLDDPKCLTRLAEIQRDLPTSLGARLGEGVVLEVARRAKLQIRAVACGLSWLVENERADAVSVPTVCREPEDERLVVHDVRSSNSLEIYGFGANGRDDAGLVDDVGVRMPLGSLRAAMP